ncbi:MAG: hypothetical protein DRI69_02060 [Bacteroidetes bacterium]|nr:MAG: hypothetical protein DRI69_02060 [Bacteroidota bacterium]
MKNKSIFLILVLSTSVVAMQAQQAFNTKDDKITATTHIKTLNKGVLLVRLPSNRKKIEALQKTLEQDLSEREFKNVSKTLNRTLDETEKLHTGIISAMESAYSFSSFAFFMDYDTREVLEGKSKLYQADMKAEFELDKTTAVYILSVGRTTETTIDAFLVMDSALNILPQPFPSQISRSGFAGLFGNDTSHIKRLNKKLWRYFNSLTE